MADLSAVFTPGLIGRLRVPHRVVMGAMHLSLESRDDGGAALAAFYVERARGGAGLMVTRGAAVSSAGSGGPPHRGARGAPVPPRARPGDRRGDDPRRPVPPPPVPARPLRPGPGPGR